MYPPRKLTDFRKLREDRLKDVTDINMPVNIQTGSEKVVQELKEAWNMDELFHPTRLLDVLVDFYESKSQRVLEENRMLMGRWTRFCRSSHDAKQIYASFQSYQKYLRDEYVDSVQRFERLSEARRVRKERPKKPETKPQEKPRESTTFNAPKNSDAKPATDKQENNWYESTLEDPGFYVPDVLIFVRHLIRDGGRGRDLNLFKTVANVSIFLLYFHSKTTKVANYFQ